MANYHLIKKECMSYLKKVNNNKMLITNDKQEATVFSEEEADLQIKKIQQTIIKEKIDE